MAEDKKPISLSEWVSHLMALGTWLFGMWQSYHGVHYVPDEWVIGVMLAPYSTKAYLSIRDQVGELIKILPKKDA